MTLSNILSFIAIVVSIISLINSTSISKKVAEKTLNTRFFNEIYSDKIVFDLPKALTSINTDDPFLSSNCEAADELVYEILHRSLFYKYFDEPFYEEVKEILVALDELLIELGDPRLNIYIKTLKLSGG